MLMNGALQAGEARGAGPNFESKPSMQVLRQRFDNENTNRSEAVLRMYNGTPMTGNLRIMIVAGESSGDAHAARLVKALREGFPDTGFEFFGSAGRMMQKAGVRPVVDAEKMAIIGALEIARELPMFLGAFRRLKRCVRKERPDVAILVDFPDFNLRLARALRKADVPVVYYISPQVWAWKKFRVRSIRKNVDLLLSILPFEKAFYDSQGFPAVEYVGNPIAGEVESETSREEFRARYGIDPEASLVALLPGSRSVELRHMVPVLLETAELIKEERPGTAFVMPLAPARTEKELELAAVSAGFDPEHIRGLVTVVREETYDALHASDAAAVTSGTATLETAVLGTPMTVIYRASALNYRLLRPFISIDTFGLVNLVAGKKVAKELIQGDLTARSLADEMLRLLDPDVNADVRRELALVREKLGGPGASSRAAEAVMRFLDRSAGLV